MLLETPPRQHKMCSKLAVCLQEAIELEQPLTAWMLQP